MRFLFASFCEELHELDSESFNVKGLQCSLLSDSFPTPTRDLNSIFVMRIFDPKDLPSLVDLEFAIVNQFTGARWRVPDDSEGGYEFKFDTPYNFDGAPVIRMGVKFLDVSFPEPGLYRFDLIWLGSKVASMNIDVRAF